MKWILSLLIFTFLSADFTLTYRINNKIIQTSYYKDVNHTLFKFKESNKTLQELIILDNKKYLKYTENGDDKIYEIPKKEDDINIFNNKKIKYKIIQSQENGGYSFKTQKWVIQRADKNETIIVSNDKKIYPKIKKMVYALKKLLPKKQERQATIFDMGNGYALIKSDNIEFLSNNEQAIDSSIFKIKDKNKLDSIAQKLDRCSMHICCGLTQYIKPPNELYRYINHKDSSWKVLNIAKCSNNNIENAILTNGDNYVVIELTHNKIGKIDNLTKEGILAENIDIKKINGYILKSTYIPSIDTTIEDIKLPSKTITIYTKGELNLDNFRKNILYLN